MNHQEEELKIEKVAEKGSLWDKCLSDAGANIFCNVDANLNPWGQNQRRNTSGERLKKKGLEINKLSTLLVLAPPRISRGRGATVKGEKNEKVWVGHIIARERHEKRRVQYSKEEEHIPSNVKGGGVAGRSGKFKKRDRPNMWGRFCA